MIVRGTSQPSIGKALFVHDHVHMYVVACGWLTGEVFDSAAHQHKCVCWQFAMAERIARNPHFIVNRFRYAGISHVHVWFRLCRDNVHEELEDQNGFEDELESDQLEGDYD